eukprot:400059_1
MKCLMFIDPNQLNYSKPFSRFKKKTVLIMETKCSERWNVGDSCEVYSNSKQEWFDAEIVDIFQHKTGAWFIKVKLRHIYTKILPMESNDIRRSNKLKAKFVVQKQNTKTRLLTKINEQMKENQPNAKYISINFGVTWQHISTAIKHELYDKVARFFATKTQLLTHTNIHYLLQQLKQKHHVKEHEINYIYQLINSRAKLFEPLINKNPSTTDDINDNKINISEFDEWLEDKFKGLSFELLRDIYSVHNSFLFTTHQFKVYSKRKFVHDINKNNYFKEYILKPQFIEMIDTLRNNMPTIDLFPQYIIDDDMYSIWKYFFSASRLVAKLKNSNSRDFILKIVVIPSTVISIYNPNIIFPYTIDNLEDYLRQKSSHSFIKRILSSTDLSNIDEILSTEVDDIYMQSTLVVVDRRLNANDNINADKLYVLATNDNINDNYNELNFNYFMSLQFQTIQNITRCHLFYGINDAETLRFYPEFLTDIIPRFFVKNNDVNCYESVQKLYEDIYKHGFAPILNDPLFDKYYKIVTGWTHVSVNYDRNIENNPIKPTMCRMKSFNNNECNSQNKLDIDKCSFIQYIMRALALLQTNKCEINMCNYNEFNLSYLTQCYNHIICVHAFCSHFEIRKMIKEHIQRNIGICSFKQQCKLLINHVTRNRHMAQYQQFEKHKISVVLLKSCLNSLHCYL